MEPLESKMLDIWWSEVDEETQKHAETLTWTKELWDKDYNLRDLPANEWWWKDMTAEQRKAAQYFGYSRVTWDETGEDIFETADGVDVEIPKKDDKKKEEAAAPKKKLGRKKQQQDGDKTKQNFRITRFLGGSSGTPFDHRNQRFIESIEVFTHGKVIDGIKATYCNHQVFSAGTCSGKSEKLTLGSGEYINRVEIRADKVVQELTFYTNKGKTHGPWGGHGRLLHHDKKGVVQNMPAPSGKCLCGILGRESKLIDAIALRWGPTDTVPGV